MEARIAEALRDAGRPIEQQALLDTFLPGEQEEAMAAVGKMLAGGKLLFTKKRKIALPEQSGLRCGRVQGNARGFGFFIPDDGGNDLYIPAEDMRGAMHGDKVWIRESPRIGRNGAPEAEVVLIAERALTRIVGTYEKDDDEFGYVIPDDTRIAEDVLLFRPTEQKLHHGDKVVVRITQHGDGRRPMMGEIEEVLGSRNEAGTDILSIIKRLDLPTDFSKAALRHAKLLNRPVSAETIAAREDLRGMKIITIDGADAKDLDDAVSLTETGGKWLLGVHIADVSHYVKPGTALDKEAFSRGTSVYLPDRVLPMFPPDVSNGVCSLTEGTEKLTLSCFMEIGQDGSIRSYRFAETVIKTAHRMTYDDVNAIFAGDTALRQRYSDVVPMLEEMCRLMGVLRQKRVKRGCIDFELPEAKITLNEAGKAVDVRVAERGSAHRMIEEFMLAANETVAHHADDLGLSFAYRVHEKPDETKLEDLNAFLHTLGYGLKNTGRVRPMVFQRMLEKAKGTPEESVISRVVLRSMRKARYAADCLGHFGLAAECYCHFTSPIRRYPDLVAHRMLKEIIRGKMTANRVNKYDALLPDMMQHCSDRELAAMEAERTADDLKKAEYMQGCIGAVERGIISGVTQFGLFVEFPNTTEGMVRIASIPGDYFAADLKHFRLTGKSSGRTYCLGDTVKVRVLSVDMANVRVELELIPEKAEKAEKTEKRSAKKPQERKNIAKRGDKRHAKRPERNGKRPKRTGKVAKRKGK
ncbi:MAG: ribonuclease R [Clostridiales bacterium]|nr:ribonuclease R [Clostridiales bacterium]